MTDPGARMTEATEWQPIRNGVYYCSPRCGGGKFCKYADYVLAGERADALAARMGDGWETIVHENLGWHYRIRKGIVTIYEHRDRNQPQEPVTSYSAWIEPGVGQFIEHGETPEEALGIATQNARSHLSRLTEGLNSILGEAS